MMKISKEQTKTEKTKIASKMKQTNNIKNNRGITLIALVVTIVVLIILATISINAVLGENGIIRKAEQAKELHEQGKQEEQNNLDNYEEYVDDYLTGGNKTDKYLDDTLPVAPRLAKGMTKVKYNSATSKWEKVTDDKTAWYDYDKKEWANVVLPAEAGDIFLADGTLDESKKYVQLVWIPRYAYQITSQYHQNGTGAGNINVVFVDTANQDKDKKVTYKTTYPNATTGSGMSDYVVHPAFEYGGNHIEGFWMGKFESSHTNCTTDETTGSATYTGNEVMMVKPNVTSWRNIKIGDAFKTCLEMNKGGNPYGLNPSDMVVDPHMAKNDEWGAVAYLSKSKYGKETEEVWNNSNRSYITGMAGTGVDASFESTEETNAYNTGNGAQASTSGNATGIYDMSGGSAEDVAAYVNNGNKYLTTYGESTDKTVSLVGATTANKYRNVYTAYKSDGTTGVTGGSDSQSKNYENATPAKGHYGDAVYETSNSYMVSGGSWYSDFAEFPCSSDPFFKRDCNNMTTHNAGLFCFVYDFGMENLFAGFRVVVPVL